jgi:ubiquinone/menaquinone biosynthesis C-methylase UbiE/NAD-dependent dihydropyrimidine dehydrogenase PreA subunit
MFSYVFMKILESRPSRYDRGIRILTGGHAGKIKSEIVKTQIKPGVNVLDVGCGTGDLLADAARAGGKVTGIDISTAMLSIARRRFQCDDLKGKGTFYQAGATELDTLFADDSFDLITSTLVFSELYAEERRWVLQQFTRILKPSGVLVIADEVIPRTRLKQFIHFLIRFPLAVITYLVAQLGTKAVANIAEEVSRAGFDVFREKRSLFDSFSLIYAGKPAKEYSKQIGGDTTPAPEDDISALRTIWDFIGRWFPNPVEPGLRKIGDPGRDSPVVVTCNFHLTVRRVNKALTSTNSWLLVVPTKGINVWCAAAGGDMAVHSIITAVKTSRMAARVSHRKLILPQLCASGIDRKVLETRTGWKADFGPVYARDIPAFINRNFKKSPDQCLVQYPLSFRIEMLFCMNALVWVVVAILVGLVNMMWVPLVSALFWSAGIILYAGFPYLPGKSGWGKAAALTILEIIAIGMIISFILNGSWWIHWGWMLVAAAFTLWLGFDLKGIVGGNVSEAESLMHKLGVKSFGSIFTDHPEKVGSVKHDPITCTNCLTCMSVCPKGVYDISQKNNKVTLANPDACFNCSACVKQCPSGALSIEKERI